MRQLGSSVNPDPALAARKRATESARFASRRAAAALIPADTQGGLAYAARALPGGKTSLMELARLSEESHVRAVVACWDQLHSAKRKRETRLEILCEACEITAAEFLGAVVQAAFDHNTDISKLILAVNTPRMVQRSVKEALTKKGFRDREMLLQAGGIVPKGGGGIHVSTTAIANAKAAAAVVQPQGLPRFEDDALLVSKAVEAEEQESTK